MDDINSMRQIIEKKPSTGEEILAWAKNYEETQEEFEQLGIVGRKLSFGEDISIKFSDSVLFKVTPKGLKALQRVSSKFANINWPEQVVKMTIKIPKEHFIGMMSIANFTVRVGGDNRVAMITRTMTKLAGLTLISEELRGIRYAFAARTAFR